MSDQPPPLTLDAKDYYGVMAHFYRGEIGRIMLWRQRLDVTTNWAIAATTAVVTYGLSQEETSHLVFLFACVIALLLLHIESRRYRYYDAYRARVRLLEAHFLAPIVLRQPAQEDLNWRVQMAEDLTSPSFKISAFEALYRRFANNYIWLFLVIVAAWGVKIWADCPGARSWSGFLPALQAGQPLPAWLFWSLLALVLGSLAWLCVGAARLQPDNPEHDIAVVQQRPWQI